MPLWSPRLPAEQPWTTEALRVDKILYEFDGPLIFLSKMGLSDVLFYKVDTSDTDDLFLAGAVDNTTIEAIMSGKLSVRGAFLQQNCWLVETSHTLHVQKYWRSSVSDLPEWVLPKEGVPLYPRFSSAPDTIEQSEAFFALSFHGEQISHTGIMFGTFKKLVDGAYNSLRRILSPSALIGAKSSTFDFEMFEPRFGSLVIALKEPILNRGRTERIIEGTSQSIDGVAQELDGRAGYFLDEFSKLVVEAKAGAVRRESAESHYYLLDSVQGILPSHDGLITSIDFTSRHRGGSKLLTVTADVGQRLINAHREVENSTISVFGRIDAVNARSRAIIIFSFVHARQITCEISNEEFDAIADAPLLRTGSKIIVWGRLRRRARRDHMVVVRPPILLPPETTQQQASIFD